MTTNAHSEDRDEAAPRDGEATSASLPYMSFAGFRTLLARLHDEGVPQVFDRHYFGNLSGSLLAQIRGTLRFFDLIEDDKRPTTALRELSSADEGSRKERLRQIALVQYGEAVKLGEDNGTYGQLAEHFRSRGLSGETISKAITFYLGLAEYVDFPVSPFFRRKVTSNGGASSAGPRKPLRRRKPAASPAVDPAPGPAPAPVIPTAEVQRAAYVEMLMEMAKSSSQTDGPPSELLNRIENALGMASPLQGDGHT